jgi:hypothetical protein
MPCHPENPRFGPRLHVSAIGESGAKDLRLLLPAASSSHGVYEKHLRLWARDSSHKARRQAASYRPPHSTTPCRVILRTRALGPRSHVSAIGASGAKDLHFQPTPMLGPPVPRIWGPGITPTTVALPPSPRITAPPPASPAPATPKATASNHPSPAAQNAPHTAHPTIDNPAAPAPPAR